MFSMLGAAILLPPTDLISFGKSLIAITFFVSNLHFKGEANQDGYFAGVSDSQTLLHTWSLSVEEQFYLFFPAILLLLARWAPGRWLQSIYLAIALSFLSSVWATHYRPLTAFYNLPPRAWELLLGSLLSLGGLPPLRTRLSRELTGLLGLGLILWSVVTFTKDTGFPGLNAAFPCVGALLILYSGQFGPSFTKTTLSLPPLAFVGVLSYSWYLWHWPILVFGRLFAAGSLTDSQTICAICLSFLMAFLSFEFIETPFRGDRTRFTRREVIRLAFTANASALALGLVVISLHGIPARYPVQVRDIVSYNVERKADYIEVCGNWRREIHSRDDITFCHVGHTGPHMILFWGDSHIQQLFPLIDQIYSDGALPYPGALFAIAAGCPPTERMNNARKGYSCDTFASLALKRAEEPDIDTVFIAFSTWWATKTDGDAICPSVNGHCIATISRDEVLRRVLEELDAHIRILRTLHKRVIVALPFPIYNKSIPDLAIRNAVFGNLGLRGEATDQTVLDVRKRVLAVAQEAGADVFDPRNSLCKSDICITQLGGVSIYKDSSHIAASQITVLKDNMTRVLQSPLPQSPPRTNDDWRTRSTNVTPH